MRASLQARAISRTLKTSRSVASRTAQADDHPDVAGTKPLVGQILRQHARW